MSCLKIVGRDSVRTPDSVAFGFKLFARILEPNGFAEGFGDFLFAIAGFHFRKSVGVFCPFGWHCGSWVSDSYLKISESG